jgi:hypothetical protein
MKIKILIFISIFVVLSLAGSVYASGDHANHNHKFHISPFDDDLDKKKIHCLLNKSHHLLHCLLKKGYTKTPSLKPHCGDSPFSQEAQQTSFQKNFSQVFFENLNLPKPHEVFQSFALDSESYRFLLGTPPIPPPRLA